MNKRELNNLRYQLQVLREECHSLEAKIYKEEHRPETTAEIVKDCPRCKYHADLIDKIIYHDNGHVWPGFAGEPY